MKSRFGECLLPFSSESFVFLSSPLLYKNSEIKIKGLIILNFVLYNCKTWSLTLREEHRLRVYENRVLRKIFGPKREEVAGDSR
jgi:hypothetical protein